MAWEAAPTGDAAIQRCLTMKVLFGMAPRQTTGVVESLLRLIGLDWEVPDVSTLSRGQKTLKVNIPYRSSDGPLHLLIDSTGSRTRVKASGTPACPAARNGASGARSSSGSTRNHWKSGRRVHHQRRGRRAHAAQLLDQIPPRQEIASVTADGAFDARKRHEAIAARGAAAFIPPDAVAAFVRDHAELSNARNAGRAQERARLENERTAIKRKLEGLYDAIAEGLRSPGLKEKLLDLEGRVASIDEELARPAPAPVRLNPNLSELYRRKVAELAITLADPAIAQPAREVVRGLIERLYRPSGICTG